MIHSFHWLMCWAQLFKGQLALNRCWILIRVSFSFDQKHFSNNFMYFSESIQSSNYERNLPDWIWFLTFHIWTQISPLPWVILIQLWTSRPEYKKAVSFLLELFTLILSCCATQMDVRNRQEEIAYLRASMSRLRDDLDQQRRLNVCLKERKVRWLSTLYTFWTKRARTK